MPKLRGKRTRRFRGRTRPLSVRQEELRRQLELVDARIKIEEQQEQIRKLRSQL